MSWANQHTASTFGRICASTAAAPATVAAAALVPLIVPKRGEPSELVPGSAVASETPGATRSGFTLPSNASPCDEKPATWPRSTFRLLLTAPIETPTSMPARCAASSSAAFAAGTTTTGVEPSSTPSSPPGGRSEPAIVWPNETTR